MHLLHDREIKLLCSCSAQPIEHSVSLHFFAGAVCLNDELFCGQLSIQSAGIILWQWWLTSILSTNIEFRLVLDVRQCTQEFDGSQYAHRQPCSTLWWSSDISITRGFEQFSNWATPLGAQNSPAHTLYFYSSGSCQSSVNQKLRGKSDTSCLQLFTRIFTIKKNHLHFRSPLRKATNASVRNRK